MSNDYYVNRVEQKNVPKKSTRKSLIVMLVIFAISLILVVLFILLFFNLKAKTDYCVEKYNNMALEHELMPQITEIGEYSQISTKYYEKYYFPFFSSE